MSYRVQIDLDERAPLKDKVLLHAKFLRHLQRRKLDGDARGKTNWKMEFASKPDHFTIVWSREPLVPSLKNNYHGERFLGLVVIEFSKKDIAAGGSMIVMGDWDAIESSIPRRERVA